MTIHIIGAGISGLSAGCYLQMNGFDTEIFEKHSKPGGLCTSWQEGDYTFDGCLQWLLGSNNSNPFYKLWSELIDMDSIEFITHKTRVDLEVRHNADPTGDKVFHLYTDLERLSEYLTTIAPEDSSQIKKLIRSIRKIQNFEIPPLIETYPGHYSFSQKLGMIRHLPLLFFMLRNRYRTNFSIAEKFTNPFLKEAFRLLYDGDEYSLLITTIPLAFSDLKGAGYPVGGSLQFVRKIEEKYLSLGGKIKYNRGVQEILTDNNAVKGIRLENGEKHFSNIVLSAADWHFTLFEALKGKFTDKKILDLEAGKKLKTYYSVVSISLGIFRTFENYSHFSRFPVEEELVSPDGTRYPRLELHIYNYDPTLAPAGKTSVSVSFYTQNGEFWINLRRNDPEAYRNAKNDFTEKVIGILENKLGNIREHIEVISVATPASFYRYTGNWKGSVQGWLPGKNIMAPSPVGFTLPGLQNFYFSSHWSIPGGGLPVAIKSARDASQIICKKYGKKFSVPAPKIT